MTREQTLNAAKQAVLTDRAITHGPPEKSFQNIADLWNAFLKERGGITPPDVAIMLALLKIARLQSNPQHADSWVDLAGYAACGAELATEEAL